MEDGLHFRRSARNRSTLITLAVIWLVLLAALLMLEAAWWIIAFLGAFTLPALWDLVRDTQSGLDLSETDLRWFTGRRSAEIALEDIDHMRLDTRLDFSVRATAVLKTGRKIRLPFECTPPHQDFEDALTAQGLKVRRTHFQLRQ
ncbi:hypothetical protein JQV27_06410 [Sulfitobacter mediterraneus]|nr:hypothetical protein [Sulfitobacter mediterraneus]MBM1640273.1 hypothetical protein [Sulfitobacter mediterraneus]MBM1644321.1 hypothetical protein [Sulfitobacter mediterraneus]MBM1648368.1 hypothetical protein [Sulfitobacter mediterraneus]MBM1652413.1 hypothetical protein [Sulfitobacter mediterraneus]